MSGITGIYHLNQLPVKIEDLRQTVDAMSHRGPDGINAWCKRAVGLGHCMLRTTPESMHEKLPLVKGSLAITADARIDNRDELADELELFDRPLEKISDSEFILSAYEKWGGNCPEHLLGDFAFAIWDEEKQQLFCARDHFGVKPFFYHYRSNQSFSLASEIKGLLCLSWIPCRLNETRVADYLSLMLEDQEITTFQEIVRLPPATKMWVDTDSIRSETYWSLDPTYELNLDSDEAYASAFREIFTESVRCRLRSAFPVGSQLSGGLDSSSVTCVARKVLDETTKEVLHTFSNIFDTIKTCDEQFYINKVLEQGDCYIPHYIHADTFGPLTDIEEIWKYEDEPVLGPSHYYIWRLNQAASDAKVKVVLDGFDGDTTVCHGVQRLSELAAQQKWVEFAESAEIAGKNYNVSPKALFFYYGLPQLRSLARSGRLIAFAKAADCIHRRFSYSRRSLYLHQGIKPLLARFLDTFHRKDKKQSSSLATIDELVDSQLAERVGLQARIEKYASDQSPPTSVRQAHWQSIVGGVLSLNLELVDRYAAAFGLETRHPFLDRRLVEFCLALPSDQKFDGGFGRVIMRRGLQSILPETIRVRGGKASMSLNFINGLMNIDAHLFERALSQNEQAVSPYVDSSKWRESWQRLKATTEPGEGEKVTNKDSLVVWRSTALALWLQHSRKALSSD